MSKVKNSELYTSEFYGFTELTVDNIPDDFFKYPYEYFVVESDDNFLTKHMALTSYYLNDIPRFIKNMHIGLPIYVRQLPEATTNIMKSILDLYYTNSISWEAIKAIIDAIIEEYVLVQYRNYIKQGMGE